jgi:hypothetical protein
MHCVLSRCVKNHLDAKPVIKKRQIWGGGNTINALRVITFYWNGNGYQPIGQLSAVEARGRAFFGHWRFEDWVAARSRRDKLSVACNGGVRLPGTVSTWWQYRTRQNGTSVTSVQENRISTRRSCNVILTVRDSDATTTVYDQFRWEGCGDDKNDRWQRTRRTGLRCCDDERVARVYTDCR